MQSVRSVFVPLVAVALLSAACASTGAVPRPFPIPGSGASKPASVAGGPDAEPSGSGDGRSPASPIEISSLLETALEQIGVRYRMGGTDPEGFDCSGFTQYVFARHGLALPREARDQFKSGEPVTRNHLRPGDLLFFTTTAPGPSHVAINLDGNQFVHAPNSNGVVRVEQLDARFWSRRYLGARRIRQ
jgi:cell wall-associated NlpC family hydrolase